jgi:hypothetical protein
MPKPLPRLRINRSCLFKAGMVRWQTIWGIARWHHQPGWGTAIAAKAIAFAGVRAPTAYPAVHPIVQGARPSSIPHRPEPALATQGPRELGAHDRVQPKAQPSSRGNGCGGWVLFGRSAWFDAKNKGGRCPPYLATRSRSWEARNAPDFGKFREGGDRTGKCNWSDGAINQNENLVLVSISSSLQRGAQLELNPGCQ